MLTAIAVIVYEIARSNLSGVERENRTRSKERELKREMPT